MSRFIRLLGLCLILPPLSFSQAESDVSDVPLEQLNGKQIYIAFCARCHGDDGRGDIPQEMIENMEVPPPDLTDPYFSSREKRKDWYAVVAHGGGARGLSMAMPAWGEALSDRQIAETIEYIKSFVDQDKYPQGELNFFRGHFATKAFVEQEALLLPSHEFTETNGVATSRTKVVGYYANRFGSRFQYEVKLPFLWSKAQSTSAFGVGDLELGLKYALYDNYESLTMFSLGIESALPTGNEKDGFGAGTLVAVPYFAAAQGIGNHVQLSASVKLETPLNKSKGNPELRFALLSMLTLPESKQGFFPGVEFLATKDTRSSHHTLSIIPQLYWGLTPRGHLALSLGMEIPVAGTKQFDGKFVAFFLWDFVDGGLWW